MTPLELALLRDEGVRLTVYDDATGRPLRPGLPLQGVPTVGCGRNLLVGLTHDEVLYLLRNDIARVKNELAEALPWYLSLSPVRQLVLCNMCFNLGISGLLRFKATLAAMKIGDYERAADQMRKSKWASQVGQRAVRLAAIMRNNREEP